MLMDNSKQTFPINSMAQPAQAMPHSSAPMMPQANGMNPLNPLGIPAQPQQQQPVVVPDDGKSDVIKLIIMIFLGLLALVFLVLYFMKMKDYNEVKSDIDGQIAVAVAEAVDANTIKLENEFLEREKNPFLSFTGPEDYGEVSFKYPKTWSVYVPAPATKGGTYKAYFDPYQIDPIDDSSSIYALRLTISTKSFESVVSEYNSAMKKKGANLTMETFYIGDTVANRYTGTIPGTSFNGYIVIFKIRDKTVVLRTDSYLFEDDFNKLIESITFNS